MSVSAGKSPAVPAADGEDGSDAAAGGSPCGRPTGSAGAGEEATEEARARREAEKAELERKIATTKEEIVALEAALAVVDAAAGPEPSKP
ncbi:hypothetical protein ZWY2020_007615 [Hordeum vulgare]|nr:hypothetical protein ZWY2020_007615 [Hordeum vulgare]